MHLKVYFQLLSRFLALLSVFVFFLSPSSHAAAPVFQSYAQRDGLAADYVTSIAFAPDDAVWIGTPRGATRVQDKYWVTYTAANGLGDSWVSGIAIAGSDKTYFATNGGGLTIFDGCNAQDAEHVELVDSEQLSHGGCGRQAESCLGRHVRRGRRAVGWQYLVEIHLRQQLYQRARARCARQPLGRDEHWGVFLRRSKIGTNGVGVWTQFTQADGLASSRVNALAVAPDGRIWFATDDGVTSYDGKTYQSYKEADGLANNSARAIAVDGSGAFGSARLAGLGSGQRQMDHLHTDRGACGRSGGDVCVRRSRQSVGRTTHGLSTFGALLTPVKTLPVVLVHGWHTADSDQVDDTEFRFIKKYLERDGFSVFYAAGITPYRTLFQNAATLRDVIANVKLQTGASRVDIIAFSMGGLNTRAYLESTLYQNDVRRAIILGTPQAGVRLWYPLLTRELEDRPNEPSPIELTPEYAALFNRTHAPRATVPYDLLAGDAQTQPGLDLLKIFRRAMD